LFISSRVSSREDLEDVLLGSDFIVNCTDNPSVQETTKILDGYAQRLQIPYCVSGGYNIPLGMVGPIIVPGKTKSFEDFMAFQKSSDSLSHLRIVKDIEQSGNLGPIAGAVANMQVMEIFKYLTGKGKLNLNHFYEVDFLNQELYERDW